MPGDEAGSGERSGARGASLSVRRVSPARASAGPHAPATAVPFAPGASDARVVPGSPSRRHSDTVRERHHPPATGWCWIRAVLVPRVVAAPSRTARVIAAADRRALAGGGELPVRRAAGALHRGCRELAIARRSPAGPAATLRVLARAAERPAEADAGWVLTRRRRPRPWRRDDARRDAGRSVPESRRSPPFPPATGSSSSACPPRAMTPQRRHHRPRRPRQDHARRRHALAVRRVPRATRTSTERVMDSMDLEREKGITILAKNTAVRHVASG